MLGLAWWRLGGWLGGFVVEDSGIGLVERWRSGFGVGDGLGRWGGVGLGGELDAAAVVKGIEIHGAGDGRNGWQCWGGDGVLEGERGFGSALPEAGEEHEEEAELGEEKRGPDARLREHVH
jgi:hypothetical protein